MEESLLDSDPKRRSSLCPWSLQDRQDWSPFPRKQAEDCVPGRGELGLDPTLLCMMKWMSGPRCPEEAAGVWAWIGAHCSESSAPQQWAYLAWAAPRRSTDCAV